MTNCFERLESRQLMSAAIQNSVLTITGTAGNDKISIDRQNGQIVVNDNGRTRRFSVNTVNRIVINALGGNDTVTGTNNVNRPMEINGGNDNDTLKGGGADDRIFG